MKKLLFLILLLTTNVYSQGRNTADRNGNPLGWHSDSAYATTVLVQSTGVPVKDLTAIRLHNGSGVGYLIRQYNPPQYTFAGDSLRMYIYDVDSAKMRIAKSVDGIIWSGNGQLATSSSGNLFESVIRQNGSATNWYGLTHYPITLGGKTQYFFKITNSTNDGVTFSETADTLNDGISKWFGEDHSSFYHADSGKYYLLIRRESSSSTLNRKLSLVKTTDFTSFTPRVLVAAADSTNYNNYNSKDFRKTFYSGNMFTTGANEYWILATIYKIDSAQDGGNQLFADTAGTDNCNWLELLFSTDGDNWQRTNDTNAFIPLNNGYKQIYGLPTVVGDSLFIYSFESTARHISADTDHFDIWRYVISLADLRAYYKP